MSRSATVTVTLRPTTTPGVITLQANPPYGPKRRGEVAGAFIAHALRLESHGSLCCRVRTSTPARPARIYSGLCPTLTLLNRIKWFQRPSEPSYNHCWYCWDREYKGPPTIRVTRAEAEHV